MSGQRINAATAAAAAAVAAAESLRKNGNDSLTIMTTLKASHTLMTIQPTPTNLHFKCGGFGCELQKTRRGSAYDTNRNVEQSTLGDSLNILTKMGTSKRPGNLNLWNQRSSPHI